MQNTKINDCCCQNELSENLIINLSCTQVSDYLIGWYINVYVYIWLVDGWYNCTCMLPYSGGFMLVKTPRSKPEVIDFRGRAPAAAHQDMFKDNVNLSRVVSV